MEHRGWATAGRRLRLLRSGKTLNVTIKLTFTPGSGAPTLKRFIVHDKIKRKKKH